MQTEMKIKICAYDLRWWAGPNNAVTSFAVKQLIFSYITRGSRWQDQPSLKGGCLTDNNQGERGTSPDMTLCFKETLCVCVCFSSMFTIFFPHTHTMKTSELNNQPHSCLWIRHKAMEMNGRLIYDYILQETSECISSSSVGTCG